MSTHNRRRHQRTADGQTLEQLVSSVAAGDITAFDRVRQSTRPLLFGIAWQLLGNRANVDEVVSDVYTRLWLRCDQFDAARGSASAWLSTLCRNASIDSLRRRRRAAIQHMAVESCGEPIEHSCPESIVEQWQMRQMLLSAIGKLPLPQREMILLNFCDGLSHRQISRTHAVALGTVKSNINRSLKRLRQEMRLG